MFAARPSGTQQSTISHVAASANWTSLDVTAITIVSCGLTTCNSHHFVCTSLNHSTKQGAPVGLEVVQVRVKRRQDMELRNQNPKVLRRIWVMATLIVHLALASLRLDRLR